jgi:NADH-quinone oxidoreductase subunit J
MSITQILFWVLSIFALFSALMVVTSKNPVFSVIWLIVTFFIISGHYILLNAQFLAIVNIIVYAGAIMVLFLFVIMLMNLSKDTEPQKING